MAAYDSHGPCLVLREVLLSHVPTVRGNVSRHLPGDLPPVKSVRALLGNDPQGTRQIPLDESLPDPVGRAVRLEEVASRTLKLAEVIRDRAEAKGEAPLGERDRWCENIRK